MCTTTLTTMDDTSTAYLDMTSLGDYDSASSKLVFISPSKT